MRLCQEAIERGVFAQAIRPPTVAPGTSRLRLTAMASHTAGAARGGAQCSARPRASWTSTWRPARLTRPGVRGRRTGVLERAGAARCPRWLRRRLLGLMRASEPGRDAPRLTAPVRHRARHRHRPRGLVAAARARACAGCSSPGTDTGVGKTILSAALLAAMAAAGEPVRAHKPVVTGLETEPDRGERHGRPTTSCWRAPPAWSPRRSRRCATAPPSPPTWRRELAGEPIDPAGCSHGHARRRRGGEHADRRGGRRPAGAAGRGLHGVRSRGRARAARADRRAARAWARSTTRCSRSRLRAPPGWTCAPSCSRRGLSDPQSWSAPTARRSRASARSRWRA